MLHCCETRMKDLQKHAPTLIENAVFMIVHDEWLCTIPNAGLGNVVHELKSLKVFSCRKYIFMFTLSCEQLQESMQTARFAVSVGKILLYNIYMCAIQQLQYTLVIHCPWSCSELRAKQRLNQRVRLHLFGGMPLLPCQGLCEQGN